MQIGVWKKWGSLLLVLCVLAGHTTVFAQLQAGRIVGNVFDPQHLSVPGAIVTVTNVATNISKTVITDFAGNYVVTPVDPGIYSVSAEAPGFQTVRRNGIELTVGQSVRVELRLSIETASAELEVTAEAPLLNTEAGGLVQVINNTQIVDLPLNGRSFHELTRLAPGAVLLAATGNVQRVRPELVNGNVISGIRGSQTIFLLDGVDVSEEHQGGTWIQTSVDALQEFSVQQNAYSAEYAGAGGTLNSITKSGTNQVHGTLFEFLRNDVLDARNYFAQTREVIKRNQFGGTLGAPVSIPNVYDGRNKTFFFVSYEGQRQREGLVDVRFVPSLAQRNGDFTGLRPIYDALTTRPNPSGSGVVRTQFPGNIIPVNRLSPQALYFNKFIPLPNSPDGTFVSTPVTAYDANQITLRVDHEINASNRLFARYSTHHNVERTPAAFPALGSTELKGPAWNIAVALTTNLGPTMIHEARFSHLFGKYRSNAYFQGKGTQFNQEAGITGLEGVQEANISSLPTFSFSGYTGFAGNAGDGRPKWQDRSVYEISDNLTWLKGRHILKFGTRIYRRHILFTDSRTHNGNFSYTGVMSQDPLNSSTTGDGFADWMLGYPANVSRSNAATWWGGTGTFWHFFVQDDLKATGRLTLNLGLRYEYTPWLTGYRNQAAAFDPTQAKSIIVSSETDQIDLDAQPLARVGSALYGDLIQTTSQAGLPITVTKNDTRQIAPRVGFAWRPFRETTVIRGGYGIFYEVEGTSGRLNFNFLPFSLSETVNAVTNVVPTRTTANFFLGAPFGSSISALNWNPIPLKARVGYDQKWNFGLQQQVSASMVAEVNYVGTRGLFLGEGVSINLPPPGSGNIQSRRPYTRFGNMTVNTQGMSSSYHSLQAKLQKRSPGFWYLASYTFSKSMTNQATPQAGGNYVHEKALSSFDVPHNFAFSTGYELPFGKGKRILGDAAGIVGGLIGGWQLQGLINFRSGLPFSPTISRDVANTGVGNQRPDRNGTGKLENPTPSVWFDKSAFVVPTSLTYGNSGGNILRSDIQGTVNISLFKQFEVTENSKLQFRVEAFNLPNSAYFNAPNTQIDTAAGGRVTSTSNDPRQIQFALKYIF
jgi:hypothetical protein